MNKKLNCYCPNVEKDEVINGIHIYCGGINPKIKETKKKKEVKK